MLALTWQRIFCQLNGQQWAFSIPAFTPFSPFATSYYLVYQSDPYQSELEIYQYTTQFVNSSCLYTSERSSVHDRLRVNARVGCACPCEFLRSLLSGPTGTQPYEARTHPPLSKDNRLVQSSRRSPESCTPCTGSVIFLARGCVVKAAPLPHTTVLATEEYAWPLC